MPMPAAAGPWPAAGTGAGGMPMPMPSPMPSPSSASSCGRTGPGWRRLAETQPDILSTATAFAQVPTPPTSRYTVETCASIAGLSSNKKAALAAEGLTRCVNALGVLITSDAACNCDNNLLYAANYVSEILDTDLDGAVDLQATFDTHVNNFDGLDGPKPLILCGATAAAESLKTQSAYLGYSMSCQAWKSDTPIGALPILKEEVFHMVQQFLWNFEYPATFGLSWTATHCTALKAAQCRWWQHGENIGCTDSSGIACIGEDQLIPGKISADRLAAALAVSLAAEIFPGVSWSSPMHAVPLLSRQPMFSPCCHHLHCAALRAVQCVAVHERPNVDGYSKFQTYCCTMWKTSSLRMGSAPIGVSAFHAWQDML